MDKKEIQNLKFKLGELQKQKIKIEQIGFLTTKFTISELSYKIEDDILSLEDKKEDTQIELNLNQAYKIEISKEYILLYLDNDIKVKVIK